MKESDLNTIISKSFDDNFFGHKIADGIGGISIQNPFDGFCVLPELPIYFESKLIKNKVQAFNFGTIEDHQIENLTKIKKMLSNSLCLITLGIYIPHKMFIIMLFDIDFISEIMSTGKKSILKKELDKIIEKKLFLKVNSIERINKEGKKVKVKRIDKDQLLNMNNLIIKEKLWG